MISRKFSITNLPAPNHQRWTPSDKKRVVLSVCNGFLSITEACRRYSLSLDEFLSWYRRARKAGKKP